VTLAAIPKLCQTIAPSSTEARCIQKFCDVFAFNECSAV
jgi:hypothetical protein